ncbi:hypothetical protein DASC09_044690 [Saccharomycopsis crataegensis]|uniref:Uncharacterized protein n=1 Tax=Saccharomycopsis crataegensis TaxID=43959 RepID=A0AAV5QQZ4_9ASCO|nr:hypothetical protein DASC09_044690 [Saccharomycopsis crataegensis]
MDVAVIAFIDCLNSTYDYCCGHQSMSKPRDQSSFANWGDRSTGDFGLTCDADADTAAQLLYDMFNVKCNNPFVVKPFGDTMIDGFDLGVGSQN